MTPEDLAAALAAEDAARVLALLGSATEAERRAAAPVALRAREAFMQDAHPFAEWPRARDASTALALLGTGGMTDMRRLLWLGNLPPGGVEALEGRGADWLARFAEASLKENLRAWPVVRDLVRRGRISRPAADEYVLGMILYLAPHRPLHESLLADPDLLELEIWRLFEVEGGGEASLAAYDKYSRTEACWAPTLVRLAQEGRLSRERLLDASLQALQRDFLQFRAGWFSRFHEQLGPSPDERAARLPLYLALLSSRIPPTVSFALKALGRIEVPAADLLASLEPALTAREKGTVQAALRLLGKAAREDPARAACLATEALSHEAPEVQAAALTLLERHGAAGDPALREAVALHASSVAPSNRPRLAPWTEVPQAAATAGEEAPPIEATAALAPVEAVDELLDLLARLLEGEGTPDDAERALDGVSRLCGQRPPARRLGPLLKRARALVPKEWNPVFAGQGPRWDLCGVVLAWLDGREPSVGQYYRPELGLFLSRRCMEVAARARGGRAAPLLAFPTHSGGWLDPGELVGRLRVGAASGRFDLLQALLRLAPEPCPGIPDLPGETGAAVRYALGAEGIVPGPTADLWVAAARARAPEADDPALEARHPGLGPDAGIAARGRLTSRSWSWDDGRRVSYRGELCTEPPTPSGLSLLNFPTVVLHQPLAGDAALIRWCATIWPSGRRSWRLAGIRALASNLDWSEARWGNRAFLEALLDRRAPLGEEGTLLLALGLAAKEPGEASLATDALLSAVTDRRVEAAALGEAMAGLVPLRFVTATRWARTLGEAARVSPRHAAAVRVALEGVLASQPELRPAELSGLLQLLHELGVEAGAGVTDPAARRYLEAQRGGGKGARLARLLLGGP